MKDLTVFILTHNRGEMLLETIDSVLNQTCHDFKFIISDNSDNDKTAKLLEERNLLGKFEYRKRDGAYSVFDHLNMCLTEVDTKYFVLFHDDDIMLPGYVETMYTTINDSEYVAVGCNAYLLYKKSNKKRMFKNKYDLIIKCEKQLAEMYCSGNILPFPSYMYAKAKLKNIVFCDDFGKYSDVLWLLKITKLSSMMWISSPLMLYRLHENQSSAYIDYANQIKLIRYFNLINVEQVDLKKYRLSLLYMKLKEILTKEFKISKYKKKQLSLLRQLDFSKYLKIKILLFFYRF